MTTLGAPFWTVTDTGDEVVTLPAPSVARAVIVWSPFVVAVVS